MIHRFSRRAIACALLAGTSLLGLSASPAAAEQYQPQKFRAVDANGVDLTWGDFIMNFVEGSIGSGDARLELVREAPYRPGSYDSNSNNLNWDRIWLSHGSTSNTVIIGPRSEKFTMTGTLPSGSTLSGSGSSYTYTTADGTAIAFQDPTGSTASTSQYCNGTQTQCTLLPVSITSPDGRKVTIGWEVNTYYLNSGGGLDCPIDPSDPSCTGGLGDPSYDTRISAVSNSFGYRIAFTYASDAGGTTTPSDETWHKRTRADFYNDNVSTTTSQASVTYAYPVIGVTQVTDTGGRVWQFTGTNDRVAGIRRPGASADTTTVSYDVNAKVSSVTREGVTIGYGRVVSGSTATMTVTDPLSHSKVITSDLNVGRPTSIQDELSRTTSYQYDANGNLTTVTQPEGNSTQYTYDARGNVTQVRQVAKPGSGLADIVTSASYDATCADPVTCNQPNSTTDARGNVTDYTYDSTHGGVLTVTAPAPTTGATRPQTRYSYTLLNGEYRLTGVSTCATGSAPSCVGTADEVKSSASYDTNGNLISTSSGNGAATLTATSTMTYDAIGNLLTVDGPLPGSADTTRYRYNTARDLVGVTSPDPDGAGALKMRATRNTYTNALLTRREIGTVNSQSDTDWTAFSPAQAVDITYDTNARVTQRKVSSGGTNYALNQMSYDALGRLDCSVVRMNPAVYASLPSSACSLGASGSYGPDRISQTAYDAAGQAIQFKVAVATSDAATERTLTYSSNGKVTSLTDAENNKTTYIFDGFDRLSQMQYPSGTKGTGISNSSDYEQLGYDAASNVTSRRLRDGTSIAYSYDNLNRVTVKTLPSPEAAVSYSYDLLGRMTGASQNGYNLSFGYDAFGRQTSDGQGWGTISRSYDLVGRVTRRTWQDGFYVDYDRLVTGEISKVRENGATSGVGVLATYGYDNLGNRTSLTFGNGVVQAYAYDPLSRLTTLTNDLSGTANDLVVGGSSTPIAYNPASQIASIVRSGDAYAWTGHYNVNRGYTANGLNQYSAAGTASFTYDGRGNLTSDGTSSYTYSSENRLKTASGGISLYYDPLGRLSEYDTVSSTRFMSDGPSLAVEVDNPAGNILRRYVRGDGIDELLVWYEGNGTANRRFLSSDERGSIISATDSSGNLVGINTYDEYGIPGSANIGRFQYTGQAWLPELGVQYSKARIYSPTLGRFMQTDPIGYGDGPNWYAYVENDPVNAIDPSGLCYDSNGHYYYPDSRSRICAPGSSSSSTGSGGSSGAGGSGSTGGGSGGVFGGGGPLDGTPIAGCSNCIDHYDQRSVNHWAGFYFNGRWNVVDPTPIDLSDLARRLGQNTNGCSNGMVTDVCGVEAGLNFDKGWWTWGNIKWLCIGFVCVYQNTRINERPVNPLKGPPPLDGGPPPPRPPLPPEVRFPPTPEVQPPPLPDVPLPKA